MDLPSPLSLITKPIAWLCEKLSDWLLKRMVLPTYRLSHERWARHHRLGAHWEPLGEHIEFSVDLERPTDSAPKASRIAFRGKTTEVTKLKIVFEAWGGSVRYPENITVYDIDERPIIWTLANIPCQDIVVLDDGRVQFSIEQFQLRRCELLLKGGTHIKLPDSMIATLGHNWFLSDEWVFRWGLHWNVNSIKWAKISIQEYWRFGFGRPKVIVYSPFSNKSYREPFWRIGLRPIGWVMSLSWVVTAQFWLCLWSRQFILSAEDRLQWRWKKVSE